MERILDIHMSLDTEGVYSGLLKQLANITARVLFIILGRLSWVGVCWRKANFTLVARKGKKEEDLGSYRLVTLFSGTGNIVEQILLEAISRHMKNEKVTRDSQCRFTKTNLVCPRVLLALN